MIAALALTFLGVSSTSAEITEAPAVFVATDFDAKAYAEQQRQDAQRLIFNEGKEMVPGFEILLSGAKRQSLNEPQAPNGPMKVGVSQEIFAPVSFMGFKTLPGKAQMHRRGAVRLDEDGFTWFTRVRTPGTSAIRVQLTDVDLPPGVGLWIYNRRGESSGPYDVQYLDEDGEDPTGEIWSHTLSGDELRIQLLYQGPRAPHKLLEIRFTLSQVVHLDARFQLAERLGKESGREKAFCGDNYYGNANAYGNANCVDNAACESIPSSLDGLENAIAHIQYVDGGDSFICSGGLVNDMQSSGTPYFLTANHCIGNQASASSMEAFFRYEASCGGDCDDNPDSVGSSVVGATLLANGGVSANDFSFLRLSELPSGSHASRLAKRVVLQL